MNKTIIYLLVLILIDLSMICCGFVFGQFDGEFVNGMRMKIGIDFFGASDKYLVQAIDSKQNKFSIKTSKTFLIDKELIIDFNGLTCNMSSSSSSSYARRFNEIFWLLIRFEFKSNNLYRYKYNSSKLLLSNVFNSDKNKPSYSIIDWPESSHTMNNQTKVWFGYSSLIINNNDKSVSDWSTNQIRGCIRWFVVNSKQIKLEMKGDKFYNNCIKEMMELVCQNGNCSNRTTHNNEILDCRFSEMNTARHCYQGLSNISNVLHSYESIGDDTKSIIVKLSWITQQSINQCLMEIITRNNLFIEIYLNSFNQIILAIKHDKSINWSKHILYEISSNQIHILRIEFTESNSTFKISNGNVTKTLILPQLGSVNFINVGRNFNFDLCQNLTSKFVFHYDSKQFKSFTEPKVQNWIIILIVIISILCIILICMILVIYKKKKQKKNIPEPTLNIGEEPV